MGIYLADSLGCHSSCWDFLASDNRGYRPDSEVGEEAQGRPE